MEELMLKLDHDDPDLMFYGSGYSMNLDPGSGLMLNLDCNDPDLSFYGSEHTYTDTNSQATGAVLPISYIYPVKSTASKDCVHVQLACSPVHTSIEKTQSITLIDSGSVHGTAVRVESSSYSVRGDPIKPQSIIFRDHTSVLCNGISMAKLRSSSVSSTGDIVPRKSYKHVPYEHMMFVHKFTGHNYTDI